MANKLNKVAKDLKKLAGQNSNKKYEIIDKTKTFNGGIVLHQIRALKSFGNVTKGDIGGWIEKESNLSPEGNCWVYMQARVFGEAIVAENAQVYGKAQVFENAKVYGKARVFEYTKVYGNARVFKNARIYGNAQIYEDAQVEGNSKVHGKAHVGSNTHVSGYENIS